VWVEGVAPRPTTPTHTAAPMRITAECLV